MKLRLKGIAYGTIAAMAVAAMLPSTSEAQYRRHHRPSSSYGYWTPPGSTVRIFPIPPGGYHYGGVHIYRLPGANWPYGYPEGYRWPYSGFGRGYPSYPSYGRHRHWRR